MGDAILSQNFVGYPKIRFKNFVPADAKIERLSSVTALSQARSSLAATAVGNYALFGGGYDGSYSSVVDAYSDGGAYQLTIYPKSRYKFQNMDSEAENNSSEPIEINIPSPITGYIKCKEATLS